jgi:hypothetical protein
MYKGINECKDYQPRTNLVKNERGDLADSYIVSMWNNNFSQPLNVHWITDVRQIEIHTAEPSPFLAETAVRMRSINSSILL